MTLEQMQIVRYGELLTQKDCDFINDKAASNEDCLRIAKQMAHCYKIYPTIYNHNS